MSQVLYASAVGRPFVCLCMQTPDIAQVMGAVSKYMIDTGKGQLVVVKWILRLYRMYFQHFFFCNGVQCLELIGFVNAQFL